MRAVVVVVMGWGGTTIQCLFILYAIHSAFSLKSFTDQSYKPRESYKETKSYKCNKDSKLFDFESVGYFTGFVWDSSNRRSSQCRSVPCQNGKNISDFRSYLFNSSKCGLLMYQIFLITLVECGDIQTNPGPRQQLIRKYSVKFPCLHCNFGINKRRVSCMNCGNISHVKCIDKLSIERYKEFMSRS